MSISKSILGLNARNFLYIRKFNSPSAKRRADNKLATKKRLIKNNLPTSQLIHLFRDRQSIKDFNWELPADGFVIKPARGYGGEGILVFKKWKKDIGETVSGQKYDIKQLSSHILDIFDGVYSLQYLPDNAYIEEKIYPHQIIKKLPTIGLPDIRIIVFHKIPVMAMLRLPTEESRGKANLHLGAVGIGIDLRTGITIHGIYKDGSCEYIPETNIPVRGIKIPYWDEILLLAVKAQEVSKLGFAGVDIVIDAVKGPLVLEINSRPGLSIQHANLASLRSRLERVENLQISSFERGVELAKSLFAEDVLHQEEAYPRILSVIEPVVISSKIKSQSVEAKLDSGAYRTSLDESLVERLGLKILADKVWVRSASGRQLRPTVKLDLELGGKKISTVATTTSREHLRYPIIIGRRDLDGFLINPTLPPEKEDRLEEDNLKLS